jgi:hypothetical protein
MTAQETKLLNAFETTLSTTLGASGTSVTLTAVTDSASNNIVAPCYLVIEPDSATNREYVLVSAVNIGTKTLTLGDGGSSYRYLTGSAATSGLSHASGATIRYVPMAQHFEDLNDRIDTVINEAGTAVNTTLFLDEDDMTSNSATKGVTQQSVKAYVDATVTAEHLEVSADSGSNIEIDLDSEVLDIEGGEGIDTTTGTNKVTISGEDASTSNKGIASFSSDNFDVSSGAVTIKNSGVNNDELAGSIANAKLANSSITVTDGSSSTATALGGTITFSGTSNEVEVGESSGTITIGLPATITANVTGNVSGTSGSTTGNAATATALETARNIGGVSFDGTGNIDLPGVNTAGSQNTSGTAAGLSATLAVASGGTGATSMTDKAVVITQDTGTDTLSSVAMDANGELLIGGTSGPAVATLTAGTGVTITNADGSITIAASDVGDITGVTAGTGLTGGGTSGAVTLNVADLAVAQGGTGATSFADKAVIITQDTGTDTLAAAAMDANGELLIGGTSGPAVGTLTAGSNITITNADGGITIAASGADVTASSTTTFTNKTIDADGTGNSISNIDIGNMTSAVVVTESEGIASNDNDTTLPTSAAVKDYVDTNAGGVSLGLVLALS